MNKSFFSESFFLPPVIDNRWSEHPRDLEGIDKLNLSVINPWVYLLWMCVTDLLLFKEWVCWTALAVLCTLTRTLSQRIVYQVDVSMSLLREVCFSFYGQDGSWFLSSPGTLQDSFFLLGKTPRLLTGEQLFACCSAYFLLLVLFVCVCVCCWGPECIKSVHMLKGIIFIRSLKRICIDVAFPPGHAPQLDWVAKELLHDWI